MKINRIQLEHTYKDGFTSTSHDGIRQIKTLPYLSVVQAVTGNYDIQIADGDRYNTGNGGFFIAPSDVRQTILHHADNASKTMICRWVFLKIKLNEIYDPDDLYRFPVIIPEACKDEMNAVFDRLFAADTVFDEYVCYYEIVRLLFRMSEEKEHKTPLYVEKALAHIKTNYNHTVTVADVAKAAHVSESHLFSVFKKELGVSPITYLNNYRLSVAADELLKTDKPIVEIADGVGIGDSVYFNKLFRRAYQMSPSRYRKLYKNGRE